MHRWKRLLRPWLAAGTALALALTAGPAHGAAPGAPQVGRPPAVSLRDSLSPAFVNPKLQAAAAPGGTAAFLVMLRDQASPPTAARQGWTLARTQGAVSPAGLALAGRRAVVAALRQSAVAAQPEVAGLLKGLQAAGHVTEFRPFWIVNGFAVKGNATALKALSGHPAVARIDPDEPVQLLTGAPAGPAAAAGAAPQAAPGLAAVEWNIDRVGAPAAWALGVDGTGAVVGSIDTGVDWNHPALRTRFRGFNPNSPDAPDPTGSWFDAVGGQAAPYDDNGHGTHVTGTMVGQDGENIIGVAPGARWIAAKAFTGGGSGSAGSIMAAAQYLLAPTDATGTPRPEWAPDVINNSWGGGPGLDEWFRPMVQAWRAAGIFPAFAAGNGGPGDGSVSVPGNYPDAFAVGATDQSDLVAPFSSRGPSPYGEVKPEVAAPGVGVRSSVPGGAYAAFNGTSMATPHVSGGVALLRSVDAGLDVDQIEQILTGAASPRIDGRYADVPNNGYGHGRLDVFAAVTEAVTGSGTISGRIAGPGDDLEAPALAHAPAGLAFAGIPVPVAAVVGDAVGVTRVDLYARRSGDPLYTRIPMARQDGDHRSGTWQAGIPGGLVQVPGAEYYLEAMDGSGNIATSGSAAAPHRVEVRLGVTPGYLQDFEAQPEGWIHGGTADPWQWGAPTSGPGAANSGQKLFATNLSGNYADNANAWLLMPPVDLTGTPQGGILRFAHWYDLEPNFDFGRVHLSLDGENWAPVATYSGASGGWQTVQVDLRPYAGQVVYLLFQFTSDGSVTRPGWYLDDVTVLGPDAEAPAAPTALTAAPDALGGIALTWAPPAAADLGSIRVYRGAAPGGPYTALTTLDAGAAAYTDGTPPAGVPSYYAVTALDFWGNESPHSAEASATPADLVTVFADDMEAGPGAWTHGGLNDDWQHGAPAAGPGAAYSGASVWGTNLAGAYRDNADAWLMTPDIDLTAHSAATLTFAHWYELETRFDFGRVEASADAGNTWTQLAEYTANSPAEWEQAVVGLDAYAGQVVRLRFRLTTDGSVTRRGWYLDDVRVAAVATAGSPPAATHPVPAKPKPVVPPPSLRLSELQQAAPAPAAAAGPGIAALPVHATVTVAETGRTVRTNPADGRYTLRHAAGTWTVVAEAYGFFPAAQPVELVRDAAVTLNFMLEPIPPGALTGTVTDRRTGAPVAGARVAVAEDARVAPVTTGADGRFHLTVLQGTYTLQVTMNGYYPFAEQVTVPGNGSVAVPVELRTFVGIPGEVAFDDGSGENAWAFFTGGNGWAVRFSLPEGSAAARLTGARFRLWDNTWPSPGGTQFRVAVYAADGPGGAPGSLLAGPLAATGRRDGTFSDVDLSALGLMVAGDFYVAYIQDGDFPTVPGLATDENEPLHDRSWTLVGGVWSKAPRAEGNRMIRALVETEVPTPAITDPADGTYTNRPAATVTGLATSGTTVTVYNGSVAAGSTTAAAGRFSVPVALGEGENILTAVAATTTDATDPSAPVRVVLDTAPPVLAVASPADGLKWNRGDLTVTGQVADNLGWVAVTVNGTAAQVGDDGTYTARILVNEGENPVHVVAADRAGNTATETRTVHVRTTPPAVTGVEPAADVTLYPGDTLTVRFASEAGLEATYSLVLAGNGVSNLTGTPMAEMAPGVYAGTYTAPAATDFTGARVVVQVRDAYGNEARATAAGAVTVASNRPPQATVTGPGTVPAGRRRAWSSAGSTDPDGSIAAYAWDMGDGARYTTPDALHRYRQAGTYTITLTVTDDRGAAATTTHTVVVTGR